MPCSFNIYIGLVYFFNICFGVVQYQKQLGWRQGRKTDQNIQILQKLKKITSWIHSNCSNYSSHFQILQILLLFVLFHLKNVQVTVQVCCLFYFSLHGTFFKGKVKREIFGGFYLFFSSGLFKKNGWFFCLGPITSTLKIVKDI